MLGLDVVGGIATFSRSWSAITLPGVVLEPRDDAVRDPGEQDRYEICARLRILPLEVREHARVEDRQQPCELRVLRVRRERAVSGRIMRVPPVLLPSGMTTSLISGLPRRETWTHGPDSDLPVALSIIRTLRRLAPLQTPITDELGHRVRRLVRPGQLRDRDLDRDRVDVERAVASTPGAAGLGIRCRFWNGRRSARSKVEPRSTKKPS